MWPGLRARFSASTSAAAAAAGARRPARRAATADPAGARTASGSASGRSGGQRRQRLRHQPALDLRRQRADALVDRDDAEVLRRPAPAIAPLAVRGLDRRRRSASRARPSQPPASGSSARISYCGLVNCRPPGALLHLAEQRHRLAGAQHVLQEALVEPHRPRRARSIAQHHLEDAEARAPRALERRRHDGADRRRDRGPARARRADADARDPRSGWESGRADPRPSAGRRDARSAARRSPTPFSDASGRDEAPRRGSLHDDGAARLDADLADRRRQRERIVEADAVAGSPGCASSG